MLISQKIKNSRSNNKASHYFTFSCKFLDQRLSTVGVRVIMPPPLRAGKEHNKLLVTSDQFGNHLYFFSLHCIICSTAFIKGKNFVLKIDVVGANF